MSTHKLVIDIETTGLDYDSLDEFSKEYIEKYAESPEDLEEAKTTLGFSPLTGEIAAIGMLNPDSNKGAIYVRAEGDLPAELEPGISLYAGTEAEILSRFWDAVRSYNCFITFNGRCFDAPYLMIRSAVLGIVPTKNLMTNRYLSSQPQSALHVDLYDQLTFYKSLRTRSSLHFWCQAFGIPSPKANGVTGDDVGKLMQEKKYFEVAKYNSDDLKATAALFEKWQKYLSFQEI